ncbi:hypothetical protein [Streptomyces sp. UNOC14_S4]|uniref:hypothetical protein n=1 Tax=Streptomyces sp. UNOC14_S4 TaxID=2872340 RepID=UPI001E5137BD|nr:hypothetical protein [Streptomyces sp. UNOC14_S4]MCC3765990.1 hypothetical protein [Streptomyces sp. UNOC14_S4]
MARLAVQAGDFLAQHTKRPTPSDEPPNDTNTKSILVDGWVRTPRWRPIVPTHGRPSLAAMDPEAVLRRATSAAAPSTLRGLLERAVRILHAQYDIPDGVALTLGVSNLPDAWWTYLTSGWLATITGAPGQSLMLPLPPVPTNRYGLTNAIQWLQGYDDLQVVRDAFRVRAQEPGAQSVVDDALYALRYNEPTSNREARTILARLLSLHIRALQIGDESVIDLTASLRARA